MISSKVYIDQYDWEFEIFYAVDCYWAEKIVSKMKQIGAPVKNLLAAYKNMAACKLDRGLTYSNMDDRISIVVIGLTTNQAEFMDSFSHEIRHLTNHICRASGIDTYGEESCYLTGYISKILYPDVEKFMCGCNKPLSCHCHEKEKKQRNRYK